jgi:uncharacterized protein (TIGR02001 family)
MFGEIFIAPTLMQNEKPPHQNKAKPPVKTRYITLYSRWRTSVNSMKFNKKIFLARFSLWGLLSRSRRSAVTSTTYQSQKSWLEELLMKMKQKLIASAALLSAVAGFTAPAQAEVAATIGVSNMYYWRGFDLGGGAALIGDVNVSSNGFVAGLWTSSGDGTLGTEYDIYAGYSGSAGDFTYGLSVVNYNYANPKGTNAATGKVWEPVNPGDYVELIPSIGYGPFKLTYYDAVVADHDYFSKDYSYMTAELIFTKFALKYGQHSIDGGDLDGVAFLDATYKFNDKLSFTVGKIIDDGNNTPQPDEAHFVVNLTLPIQ